MVPCTEAGASLPLPTAADFLSGASIALKLPNRRQPPQKTGEAEAGVGTPSKQIAARRKRAGPRPITPEAKRGPAPRGTRQRTGERRRTGPAESEGSGPAIEWTACEGRAAGPTAGVQRPLNELRRARTGADRAGCLLFNYGGSRNRHTTSTGRDRPVVVTVARVPHTTPPGFGDRDCLCANENEAGS